MDLLEWIRSNSKTHPFITVPNSPEVLTAAKAMKLGATDYTPMQLAEDKLPQLIRELQHEDKKSISLISKKHKNSIFAYDLFTKM